MGIQLGSLRKQALGSSNALQKTPAQLDGSITNGCSAANDVMEPVFPAEIAQQCCWLNLQSLGVVPSFSRPRVSDDNPFSEALFRTLKYRPDYPERAFANLEDARAWVVAFVRWYNHEHQHSGIRFVTPHQRHSGQDEEILRQRHALYQQARRRHPERWSGATRNWTPIDAVELTSYRPKLERLTHQEINQAA